MLETKIDVSSQRFIFDMVDLLIPCKGCYAKVSASKTNASELLKTFPVNEDVMTSATSIQLAEISDRTANPINIDSSARYLSNYIARSGQAPGTMVSQSQPHQAYRGRR
ncbi:hypothetical protein RRG08_050278 [Elysia crispata]|uniref:Uncharacterized protein n=1 Tax=Elysia crispata TaxID=231223 RepID=A0AAE1E937_9GAST|nr:hypothetical protein RRG08_050278 [Elysia crispata]